MKKPKYSAADALIYACEKTNVLIYQAHENLASRWGTKMIDGEEYLPSHAATWMDLLYRFQHEVENLGTDLGLYHIIDGHLVSPRFYGHGGRVHLNSQLAGHPDSDIWYDGARLQHPAASPNRTSQIVVELTRSPGQGGDCEDA